MRKNLSANVIAFLLVSLMFISSLTILSPNIAYAQESMTFTSGEKINFTSNIEMEFKGYTSMDFWSGVEMKFGTNITMQFRETAPDGTLAICEWIQIVWPAGYIPPTCSWWEVIDPDTGKDIGEIHIDGSEPPDTVHIDQVWPGPIPIPVGAVITAKKKVDIIESCQYYEVHWPSDWYPEPCTWWELMDPETGELTGVEFHVDWTNESCEFHIDEVLIYGDPGVYVLPFPWYEVWAIQKIPIIEPCQYYEVHWPSDWYPEPCTWWELMDPETGVPTGVEFHVDWTNESCEFHIDEVLIYGEIGAYKLPYPGVPFVWAEQKIVNITACDWLIVYSGFLPEVCSWWEILDDTGAPTGLEFHVDENDGISMFHVDATSPDTIIEIPPTHTVRARKKVGIIQECDWYIVDDPSLTPETCSWWEILDPVTGEPTGWEFHVDESDTTDGMFHVDIVIPGLVDPQPSHMAMAEKKIDDILPCDWFVVIDPPTGWVPEPCSWWEIVWPDVWAGITFHVDESGDGIFHIDFVDDPADPPIPPPWNVTAKPYEKPPDPWYIKSPYPDYASSGMPDFDQKQDMWGPGVGIYTWCGPVAVANSLWWFDSEYEYYNNPSSPPPPAISDSFPMVTAYGPWDDHDVRNVDPLVHNLAWLMDTDGQRTGLWHIGTGFIDMQVGISQYLQQQGINPVGDCDGDGDVDDDDMAIIEPALGSVPGDANWNMAADIVIDNVIDLTDLTVASGNHGMVGMFYEHTEEFPDFLWIEDEIMRCEDVVLFLEFWQDTGAGEWMPLYDNPSLEAGHFVTCAGVNSTTSEILISDPYHDAYEAGLTTGRSPIHHPFPHTADVHNDTQYVSHDAYPVAVWPEPPPSPYPGIPVWEIIGYLQALGYDPSWHAFIRAAVVTSPLAVHDAAVTNVTTSKDGCTPMPTVCQGYTAKVNVTVLNEGDYTENFTVTAYANSTIVGTQMVNNLVPTAQITLTFIWNTTGFAEGNYTVSAYAWPVPGEVDTVDNTYVNDVVKVVIPGDLNGDDIVDIFDCVSVALAFSATPTSPNWNPNADVNNDDLIDIFDIVVIALHFGETYS